MPLDPDSYDRLRALYKRFDHFPEARLVEGGAVLKSDAWLAFLELRPLILKALNAIHAELRGWRLMAEFFAEEQDGPTVLLWAPRPESGEMAVMAGYWDDDARAWYREGQGPDHESEPLEPSLWMAIGEVTLLAGEFVAIPRMA